MLKISLRDIKKSSLQDKILELLYSDEFFKKWLRSHFSELKSIFKNPTYSLIENILPAREVTRIIKYNFKNNFDGFCKYIYNKTIDDYLKRISKIIDKNSLIIYRSIGIKDINQFINNIINKKSNEYGTGVGIYWSFEKNKADLWEGNRNVGLEIKITAEVNLESIDTTATVLANLHIEYGTFESEITLLPGTPIKIINIEIQNLGPNYNKDNKYYVGQKIPAMYPINATA